MKNAVILLAFLLPFQAFSQELDSLAFYDAMMDSIESSMKFEYGKVQLGDGIGTINVPEGFKYLNPEQSAYVLVDIWGNPDATGVLGMIFPDSVGVSGYESWAFIITYDAIGYVKDKDANKIDYDELLKEMQTDIEAENEQRRAMGYEGVQLVGWAAEPFYDKERKILHWAKELHFESEEASTLNYNIRVLGRKGVLMLNAVAGMDQLSEVNQNIDKVLASITFTKGNQYADFNPKVDEVAAWTIGGLVAGKILAKAGIFALILKNIKLIAIAVIAAATGIWRWLKGRQSRSNTPPTQELS